MKLITLYLFGRLGSAVAYSLLALVALLTFFELPSALSDVGKGNYTTGTALAYVGLQLFGHLYTMLPLAVLVGSLTALSQLASSGEFGVMRTSGITLKRLALTIAAIGLAAGSIGLVVGEWLAPPMTQKAEQMRLNAIQKNVSLGRSGLWFKQGNDKILVGQMLPDGQLRQIHIYHYHPSGSLKASWYAESAQIMNDGTWVLENIRGTEISANQTHIFQSKYREWESSVARPLLQTLLIDSDQMPAGSLFTYIRYLEQNGQKATAYQTAFWQKILYPLSCTIMALSAFAFAPRQTRTGSIGVKIFTGIAIGIAFHFGGRLFGHLAHLGPIPPLLAAALPILVLALIASWWTYRQEKR